MNTNTNGNGHKRAAIYIRTSTEKQAEKVSPEAQAADCRELCARQGYQVVEVYSDTEKYRAGKRLVEPSGTRADRPQLKRMLADARADKFDLIVAWREDRLYRGMRPMLDVLDCIEQTKIDVELAKENFDKRIAPVKAWAAKMELDARRDRIAMGVAGRFAQGKVWLASIPYGYRASPKQIAEIEPTEAKWVKLIWQWKAERVSYGEIRRRLIEGNAPQRRIELCRFQWQETQIRKILTNPVYYTGIQSIQWGDKIHEINYPILIDADTAQRVREAIAQAKHQPIHHVTHDYLAIGFVKCAACKRVMCAYTSPKYVKGIARKNVWIRKYRCQNFMRGNKVVGCPHCANVNKVDAELWRKVNLILSDNSDLDERIQTRIQELEQAEADAEGGIERIKRELGLIEEERQWIITQARKKSITEDDMDKQLAGLDAQTQELRRELADKSLLVGDRAGKLIAFVNRYRADMRVKLEWLNSESRDEEERKKQHRAKREIVEAIVRTVWIYEDKSVKVEFEFDIPEANPNPAILPDGFRYTPFRVVV